MVRFLVGACIVLHGLVHLLYAGQAWRLFELRPGMLWPDDSWAFSRLLGERVTRLLATAGCSLAAVGFAAAGAGFLLGQAWSYPVAGASAALSSLVFVFFWDGKLKKLSDQGLIAMLVNAAVLIAVLILR